VLQLMLRVDLGGRVSMFQHSRVTGGAAETTGIRYTAERIILWPGQPVSPARAGLEDALGGRC